MGPQFLPELWNDVIDSLGPPRSSSLNTLAYVPDESELQRIRALAACALVCRAWTHRAQRNLYSIVQVCNGAALWKLIHMLSSYPHLIAFVTHLVATPAVWASIDTPISSYLPIIPFLSLESSWITHIQLVNVVWDPRAYGGQYALGFFNKSVTHFELIGAIVSSLTDILPFITSFDNLTHLSLVGIELKRQVDEQEVLDLQALPPSRAVQSLRSLELGGEGRILGLQLFGTEIESLHLFLQIVQAPSPSPSPSPSVLFHCRTLSQYSRLKNLGVTLEPWMSLRPPLAGSADEGERVWSLIRESFLSILQAVQSSTVSRLEIALVPQQQDLASTQEGSQSSPCSAPCRYRHTRLGMLDTLFASDVRDILLGPVFASLRKVVVVINESPRDSIHNTQWWHSRVVERLGLLPDTVHIEINRSGEPAHDGVRWNK